MKDFYKEWNELEKFHKVTSSSNPLKNEGIKAFLELSKFAKKLELKVPKNPSFYFRFGSNAHYNWLIKTNKLVKIISEIPNYEPRIKKFFNNDNYFDSLSALYELEMALKFKLQGFEVVFTDENTPDKIPDIEIKLADKVFNLEVTSLNNPDQDKEIQEFYSQLLNLILRHKVEIAGNIIDVPKNMHSNLLQEIENRIIESKEKGEITKIIEEGKLILEIAPNRSTEKLTLTGFHFVNKELKNIEDKVNQVIKDKSGQLSVNQNPGILCIYSGSRTINIEKLYTKAYDKINPYLQTMPNLSALVLSSYSDFYPLKTLNHLKSSIGSKVLCVLEPRFGETEQSIIWKNSTASYELPPEFIESYETFDHQVSEII